MDAKQLKHLFEGHEGQYVSGETLSRELNISRTAIWKQIRKLEEQGFRFEASRKLGYKLLSSPDPLVAERIISKLTTERFGRQIKVMDSVQSTQLEAKALAEQGAEEGTLVIAERQLGGRGRMGRTWISPAGKGVWMSMVMRPGMPMHFAPQLTLLTAVALCRSLRRLTSLDIGIKWPNDLLIGGKKISGILLESAAEEERLRYVIAGIGISVNLDADDYPLELQTKATSLRIAADRRFDRSEIITSFLNEWEQLYLDYTDHGFEVVRLLWETLSISLHKPAAITTPQETFTGIPIGLHESGALIVHDELGKERIIFSAEMGEPLSS